MDITKWEYMEAHRDEITKLNELGKQGWEAVGSDNGTVTLKRPCGRIHVNEIANRVEIQQTPDFSLDNTR